MGPLSSRLWARRFRACTSFCLGGIAIGFIFILLRIVHRSDGLEASVARRGARRHAILTQHPCFLQDRDLMRPSSSKEMDKALNSHNFLARGRGQTQLQDSPVPGHTPPQLQLNAQQQASIQETLMQNNPKTLVSYHQDQRERMPVTSTTQGLNPNVLLWNKELLSNMVQMAPQAELFRAVLGETRSRVQSLLQDDTRLLSELDAIGVQGRVKSAESITRKILYKTNRYTKRLAAEEVAAKTARENRKKERKGSDLGSGAAISGRKEHLEKVYDVVGLRVVLSAAPLPDESNEEYMQRSYGLCYWVKQLIEKNWETIAFREKDYVRNPKNNGYQSIHLTVVVNYHLTKVPVEIQIRTADMESYAQYGPAAHTRYKENFMDDMLSNSFPANSPDHHDHSHPTNSHHQQSTSASHKSKRRFRKPSKKTPPSHSHHAKTKGNKHRPRLRDRRRGEKLDYTKDASYWLESVRSSLAWDSYSYPNALPEESVEALDSNIGPVEVSFDMA